MESRSLSVWPPRRTTLQQWLRVLYNLLCLRKKCIAHRKRLSFQLPNHISDEKKLGIALSILYNHLSHGCMCMPRNSQLSKMTDREEIKTQEYRRISHAGLAFGILALTMSTTLEKVKRHMKGSHYLRSQFQT